AAVLLLGLAQRLDHQLPVGDVARQTLTANHVPRLVQARRRGDEAVESASVEREEAQLVVGDGPAPQGADEGPDLKRIRDELRQRQAVRRGARVAEEIEARGIDVDDDAVRGDQGGVATLLE